MKTLPGKFIGKCISFKTEEEAWRIAKILEECGYEWDDNDRPGDGENDWVDIYIWDCGKSFHVVGGDPMGEFTAQEFLEEMEGEKLKVGDRVRAIDDGELGVIEHIHENGECCVKSLERKQRDPGSGCNGWYGQYMNEDKTYLPGWDLVKEEEYGEITTKGFRAVLSSPDYPTHTTLQFINQLTPTPMCEDKTILQKIKALATPEPERTLIDAGIIYENKSFTSQGQDLLDQLLYEDYKDKMKELVDGVKEKKAKKKKA